MSNLITITQKGDFKKTTKFLNFVSNNKYIENKLNIYGKRGIELLKKATPIDTGETAKSWDFTTEIEKGSCKIIWTNDNMAGNVPVVILLQYGHGTKNGGYVSGIDFINPTMKPLFDQLANEIWKEVTDA